MCVICVQWELGKLTRREAVSALTEMVNTDQIDLDHADKVKERLYEDEDSQSDSTY